MNPDLIRNIAEAVVRDQLLLNWRFYVLVCVLTFIASAGGHWLAAYLRKRGETLATKADMHEILRQVSETTRATERVRSDIAQADWVAREWRTTRRLKLEELLSSAYSLDQWLDQQRSKWVYEEEPTSDAVPLQRMKLLATLYFPELRTEATAVSLAHQEAVIYILDIGTRARAARRAMDADARQGRAIDANARQAVLDEFAEGWKPLYKSARLAIAALENKASAVMAEIAGA